MQIWDSSSSGGGGGGGGGNPHSSYNCLRMSVVSVAHDKIFELAQFNTQINWVLSFLPDRLEEKSYACYFEQVIEQLYIQFWGVSFVLRNSPGTNTTHHISFVWRNSSGTKQSTSTSRWTSEFLCILYCVTHLFVVLPIFKLAFSTAIRRIALGTSRNAFITSGYSYFCAFYKRVPTAPLKIYLQIQCFQVSNIT